MIRVRTCRRRIIIPVAAGRRIIGAAGIPIRGDAITVGKAINQAANGSPIALQLSTLLIRFEKIVNVIGCAYNVRNIIAIFAFVIQICFKRGDFVLQFAKIRRNVIHRLRIHRFAFQLIIKIIFEVVDLRVQAANDITRFAVIPFLRVSLPRKAQEHHSHNRQNRKN